jgi:signal transduction histidine kinase
MLYMVNYIDFIVLPRASIIEFIAVLAAVLTILVIAKYRKTAEVKYLIIILSSAAFWAFTYGMEFIASDTETKIFWSKLSYIGIAFLPLGYFLFATAFSQKTHILKTRNIALLSAIPLSTIILAVTNEYHNLIWMNVKTDSARNMLLYEYGLWFWLFWIYSLALVFFGVFFLVSSVNKFTLIHKSQVITLLFATLMPVTGNIMYVSGLNPFPGFDWTPVLFIFSGLLITSGVVRYGLFDLVPFALNELIKSMDDGVIVISSKGVIEDYNPAVIRIFNLNWSSSIINKKFSEIFSSQKKLVNAVEKGKSDIINIEQKINDKTHYYQVQIFPVLSKKNILSGFLIQIHDITSIRLGEDRMKRINKHLLEEIKQRGKLINDLDSFAHTIAHDLRNSLGSIYSSSEAMEQNIKEMDRELLAELSGLIKRSSEKAIHITRELLILATVSNQKIEKKPLDMSAIFSEARKQIEGLINEYNAQIKFPTKWPSALGHAPWIENVWVNYLTNAIKYGGNPPLIEAGAEKSGNNSVKFWIKDNGNGLSWKEQKKLFKKYTRLNPDKAQGYGLGLSIVKRIIEKLGGRVGVESDGKKGEGSKFWFELSST